MSKERDLLVSCLDEFQYHEVPCSDLIRTIQWLLNEPEQTEQEPVAWMYCWDDEHERTYVNLLTTDTEHKHLKTAFNVMPLYTTPPKRKPLSDEEIGAHTPFYYYDTEQKAFTHGVRLAEQQHGIGVTND